VGREFDHPREVFGAMKRVRTHNMAKALLEMTAWDLYAKIRGQSLASVLGGTRPRIASGVSIGIQDSFEQLLEKVAKERAAGYQRIKIKIKPGRDYEMARAVRQEFPGIKLTVDANSAYTLKDVDMLRRLDDLDLMLIEQPLAYDDIIDHAELQRQIRTPICLDESILSVEDARKAISIGACRIINIKLGRVGGHAAARRIEIYCREHNTPVWCGGMLEAGIGRAHNIAMSTLPGFVMPGDVSASKRYWRGDIITPQVEVTPNGTIVRRSEPGIGYEVNEKLITALTVRTEIIS
jgi:o-succinylbenzoate synthase